MDGSGNKNKQWQRTCNQLKDAFDAWVDLSRAPQVLSADEKRLQEMKELLRDLKGKLDALSAEVEKTPGEEKPPESEI